jgi:Family of unknown function (DUF6364)
LKGVRVLGVFGSGGMYGDGRLWCFMRMILIYAYICAPMKERLNLTIDAALLDAMKSYAASKEMSVSELVESYFRAVTRPIQQNNILDLMDRVEPSVTREGAWRRPQEEGRHGV